MPNNTPAIVANIIHAVILVAIVAASVVLACVGTIAGDTAVTVVLAAGGISVPVTVGTTKVLGG